MDIQKLNDTINNIERELGNALLSTDIWNIEDGKPIAGYNSKELGCILFNQITAFLSEALKEAQHPKLHNFYILSLKDNKMVIVIPFKNFIWDMLIDVTKARLGVLLNSTIPEMVRVFEMIISEK